MSQRQETYEQIERYAAGEMNPEERADFERLLQTDVDLEISVQLHRNMREAIGNPERRRLLDALYEVSKAPLASEAPVARTSTFRFWMAIAATFILLLSGGLWWFSHRTKPPVPMVKQDKPEKGTPATRHPDTANAAPSLEQLEALPEKKQLAVLHPADFKPNQALDPMVGTQVRGNTAELEVLVPRNDDNYALRDGQIAFVVKGNVSDAALLRARIFNNSATDFTEAAAFHAFNIRVSNDKFNLKKALSMPPGRYYILFYKPGEEEPVSVIRFFVR